MALAARLLLSSVLLVACLSWACGGGDDGSGFHDNGGNGPTRTGTPAATATAPGLGGTPTAAGADEKTPPPAQSPISQRTPETQVTSPPAATQGTPAVEPPDTAAFLSQFAERNVGEVACNYNPSTRLTDCGGSGLYAVNPPLGGQDIGCSVGIVDGNPEYIRCTSAQPAESKYYDIQ